MRKKRKGIRAYIGGGEREKSFPKVFRNVICGSGRIKKTAMTTKWQTTNKSAAVNQTCRAKLSPPWQRNITMQSKCQHEAHRLRNEKSSRKANHPRMARITPTTKQTRHANRNTCANLKPTALTLKPYGNFLTPHQHKPIR